MLVILFSLLLGGAICLEQAGDTVSYGKYEIHAKTISFVSWKDEPISF